MKWLRWIGLCFMMAAISSAWGQNRPEQIALFYGSEKTALRSLMDTRPPYVCIDDVLRAIGTTPPQRVGNTYTVNLNRRTLELDVAAQRATYLRKTSPASIREREGVLYLRVDTLSEIFSDLLGKLLVYEPTSFTLHLPRDQRLNVRMVMRRQGNEYRLDMLYSKPIAAPKVTRNQRIIAVRLPEPEVVLDRSGFAPNEAIETIEVFDKLPDGTTELLVYMTENVTGYTNGPYTAKNPRTTLSFAGNFSQDASQNAQDEPQPLQGIQRIVIDPGHGGKDVGATGPSGLLEKDVVLQLTKELQEKLRDTYGYEVKLTRRNDIFLSHKTRTGIANNFKADLFISLHANAIKDKSARGSETFYLSLDSDKADAYDHYHQSEELLDEDEGEEAEPAEDDLSMILWDMAHAKHMEDSLRIAKYIQRELNILAQIRSRGVKQAPLKVLKGATMPAVLIEAAFISNPSEEQKLKSAEGRQVIVEAIAKAISLYDADVRLRNSGAPVEDFDLEDQP